MYKEFYLMRKEPFDSHPSPELFYKSYVHQTAWHYLLQGIKQQEPILVLAGDYGAGKTLLFLKLVRLLEQKGRMPIVAVPTPTYNFVMVLEKIVEKLLNISPGSIDAPDESRLQQVIYEYFENSVAEKKGPIYVVIDDAQEFSYAFINKLRLFASYNYAGFFPIRLIFFAHHSFLKMLTYKKLVALGQRIKRIYHLKPLNYNETREYIYFRLIHSGATGTPVFDDEAIEVIQTLSGGNPRLINNVCDNCLLLAGEKRISLIDAALVYKIMEKGSLPGIEKFEQAEMPEPSPGVRVAPLSPAGSPYPPDPIMAAPGPLPAPAYMPGPVSEPVPMPAYYPEPPVPQAQPYPYGPYHGTGPGDAEVQGSTGSNFWSRYGKISVIILLLLIAFFLASYVFRSGGSERVGLIPDSPKRIIRKIPSLHYTIKREMPGVQEDEQYREKEVAGEERPEQPERLMGEPVVKRMYEPVLFADNLGH